MSESPKITSILAVAGTGGIEPETVTSLQETSPVFIGVEIDGAAVAWGTCIPPVGNGQAGLLPPYRTSAILATVYEMVSPVLVGRKVDRFRELASLVQTIQETVSVPVSTPPVEQPSPGISRREIITGFLVTPDQPAIITEVNYQQVTQRLHPSLRLGLSQALLQAVALVRQRTLTEVLTEEFDLPLSEKPISIQVPIQRGQTLHLPAGVGALTFQVDPGQPEKSLGQEGEHLQRFVRELRSNITRAKLGRPITIHLDLAGAYSTLYEDNIGKILGALYGLEQAAAPEAIFIQDPILSSDSTSQTEALGQLRQYLQMRKMSLRLVAGRLVQNLDDVHRLIREQPVHMIQLDMAILGSIQETIFASQACRDSGLGVLLTGPADLSAQVALAISPDYVSTSSGLPVGTTLALLSNEMARILAVLAHKDARSERRS